MSERNGLSEEGNILGSYGSSQKTARKMEAKTGCTAEHEGHTKMVIPYE